MKSGHSNLFSYQDYRAYLRDWYRERKKSRGSISLRSFAKKAGLKSFNFLKLVMEGKRNLAEESLVKVMEGLQLNKQEREFFRNLVFFNQAKTPDERNTRHQNLLRSRKYSELKPIEKDRYDYYAAWYHPAVRELIASRDFDGSPEWIANRLFPSVTVSQAAKSIELLERLGFVRKDKSGRWKQTDPLISTGAEVASHVIHAYHKKMLDLAKEILDDVRPERRDVSTMTLGVSRDRFLEIKKKIQDFRRDILKLVSTDTRPEEVLQLSIQMIPLTRDSNETREKRL